MVMNNFDFFNGSRKNRCVDDRRLDTRFETCLSLTATQVSVAGEDEASPALGFETSSTYLSETCTYCAILHITTVSVERSFAISFPLRSKATITKRNGSSWHQPHPLPLRGGTPQWQPAPGEPGAQVHRARGRTGLLETMTWVSTIYFFLPMLCLTLLYGLICRKLRRSGQQAGKGPTRRLSKCRIRSKVILYDLRQYFSLITMLFYLKASINPMLYIMSTNTGKRRAKSRTTSELGAAGA
nr:PREDICTED: growth hormone secretagogue receptor type 1-like [Pelecanus crispus]